MYVCLSDLNRHQASRQPSTASEAQQFKHYFNYLLSREKVTSMKLWIQVLSEHPALSRVMFACSEQNAIYTTILCVDMNEYKAKQALTEGYTHTLVEDIQSQHISMCEYA